MTQAAVAMTTMARPARLVLRQAEVAVQKPAPLPPPGLEGMLEAGALPPAGPEAMPEAVALAPAEQQARTGAVAAEERPVRRVGPLALAAEAAVLRPGELEEAVRAHLPRGLGEAAIRCRRYLRAR